MEVDCSARTVLVAWKQDMKILLIHGDFSIMFMNDLTVDEIYTMILELYRRLVQTLEFILLYIGFYLIKAL